MHTFSKSILNLGDITLIMLLFFYGNDDKWYRMALKLDVGWVLCNEIEFNVFALKDKLGFIGCEVVVCERYPASFFFWTTISHLGNIEHDQRCHIVSIN